MSSTPTRLTGRQIVDGLPWPFLVWTVVLVVGFGLVFSLGQPVTTAADERAAAFDPPTPVTEEDAIRSAETIVRFDYPEFANAGRTVSRRTDLGQDRFLIVYTQRAAGSLNAAGVRIAITVESGEVRVATFP